MEPARIWAQLFQNWPAEIPRRGLMITTAGEQHPFKGFMLSDSQLVLERTSPDPSGGRFILLTYDRIGEVKFIDALKDAQFATAGFVGKFT